MSTGTIWTVAARPSCGRYSFLSASLAGTRAASTQTEMAVPPPADADPASEPAPLEPPLQAANVAAAANAAAAIWRRFPSCLIYEKST